MKFSDDALHNHILVVKGSMKHIEYHTSSNHCCLLSYDLLIELVWLIMECHNHLESEQLFLYSLPVVGVVIKISVNRQFLDFQSILRTGTVRYLNE